MPFKILKPANQSTTTSGFRVLRPAQPVQPTQAVSQPAQPEEKKQLFSNNNIFGKIGNFLSESEQKLGSTIGQGLALATGTSKSIEESNQKLIDSGNELIKLAQQTTDPVKKKQRLDLAKKNFEQAGVNYKEIVPDVQKSNKQIAGEVGGTLLDVVTAGTLPVAAKGIVKAARAPQLASKLAPKAVGRAVLSGVGAGAPLGAAYGVTGALQEDENVADTIKSGLVGAGLGAAVGGATGAVGAKISNTLKYNPARAASKVEAQANKLARKIVQGTEKDVVKARNVLRTIDTKTIKTAKDLVGAIEKNMNAIGNKVDEKLLTNNNLYSLDKLATTKKVGDVSVTENFVTKALDNLEELYTKTDDIVSAEKIKQLKTKAGSQGLTAKEVNDLAREYGSEIGGKAFSKTGEPLTSVNAQSYENIRKGIKEAARSLFDDEALKTLDKELSEHIRIKDLAVKFQKGVDNLENKVKERAPLEMVGRVVGRVLDTLTGGSARGFLTSFLPSNVGNKVMNYLDLERALQKNLKALEKLENTKQFDLEKEIQRAIDYFKVKFPKKFSDSVKLKDRPGFAKLPFVGDDERDILLKKLNDLTTSDFRTIGSLKKPDLDLYQKVEKLKDVFNRNVDLPADMVDVKDILARLGKLDNPLDNVRIK